MYQARVALRNCVFCIRVRSNNKAKSSCAEHFHRAAWLTIAYVERHQLQFQLSLETMCCSPECRHYPITLSHSARGVKLTQRWTPPLEGTEYASSTLDVPMNPLYMQATMSRIENTTIRHRSLSIVSPSEQQRVERLELQVKLATWFLLRRLLLEKQRRRRPAPVARALVATDQLLYTSARGRNPLNSLLLREGHGTDT